MERLDLDYRQDHNYSCRFFSMGRLVFLGEANHHRCHLSMERLDLVHCQANHHRRHFSMGRLVQQRCSCSCCIFIQRMERLVELCARS